MKKMDSFNKGIINTYREIFGEDDYLYDLPTYDIREFAEAGCPIDGEINFAHYESGQLFAIKTILKNIVETNKKIRESFNG